LMKSVPLWTKELWCSENPEEGPWVISLNGPSFISAMQYIPDSELRKELYINYISKAGENEEVITTIMDNKLEKANILGFENYTELSLSRKMAENEKIILEMLDNLQEAALPHAIKEYAEIQEYAEKHGVDGQIEPWDTPYWSERMKEEKFQLKVEELKPYFSLDNVLRELFGIANRLFGIFIQERSENVEKWNKDVRYYDVFEGDDSNNPIIAGFYLDPYVREETKRSGAWMDSCVDKNRALGHEIPVAYLVCNGSPPSKDKPSLLSFSDVETLFHEFGHGLQHMLTKIDINDISGINGIEWDAVELPSQFMENWCYDETTLNRMAIHYETGDKMPKAMYDSLVEQKTYGAGMAMMRQISFSKLDLYIYSNWKTIREENKSIWDIQKQIFTDCCPYKRYMDEDKFLCSFQHIFSGYSAGYYSYKWAEIMSADSFGMFEENMDRQKEIGRHFRNTVLSNGGSKSAMDTFVQFRGRTPDVAALLRHNRLK
jgi:oligopeptidase A